jgi:peptide/nickel transport system substrate-binding protein
MITRSVHRSERKTRFGHELRARFGHDIRPRFSHDRRFGAATIAITVLFVAAALLAMAASAAPAAAKSPAANEKVIVKIGWMEEPDSLNPFLGIMGTSFELWHLNYDYLVGFDAATLKPAPELAKSWDVSADGKTWTFKLQEGVSWNDGTPFTAKDVAFTYNYIAENQFPNVAVYTDRIVSAKALDDTTVEVQCSTPKANILAMPVVILPEHIWSTLDPKDVATKYANDPPIVGTGAFKVVEWKRKKYVRLVANKDYWGGAPEVDELMFITYTNADTMVSDLRAGTIAGAINIPAAQFKLLEKVKGITANQGTSWKFTELGMNCYDSPNSMGNPVLLDQQFRQALNWAVNRDDVVKTAFLGYASPGSTIIIPNSRFHWEPPSASVFGYDPDKAKQILEQAGYKDVDGDGFREDKQGDKLELCLQVPTDYPQNERTAKLAVGWFAAVGIKVNLEMVDAGVLIDAQYNYKGDTYAPDYDLYIWYWTGDVDPNFMLSIYTPQQIEGWNDCLWTDKEYTKLQEQQITELDEATRIATAQKMQQIFYEQCPYIVWAYPTMLEAYNTDEWAGWVKSPAEGGSVLYFYSNVDTYKQVRPVVVAAAGDEGGLSGGAIAGIVVACVVVVGGIVAFVVLRTRRGARREES